MTWVRSFSSILRVSVVLAGVALAGLPVAGCGGDEAAACKEGDIERDGKCYAPCDEVIDCKSDPRLKCVAYPGHAEGKCFATCTANAECKVGEGCTASTTMKGQQASVCASRTLFGKPEGKLGDACAAASDCDDGHGLACVGGKCKGSEGASCAAAADCDEAQGLSCSGGKCAFVPGKEGDPCDDAKRLCDASTLLSCIDGVCGYTPGNPGDPCNDKRACDTSQGTTCHEGNCYYTCSNLAGCSPGFECRGLPAGNPDGARGVCLSSMGEVGPGQYGTLCPKTDACAEGFRCLGAEGDPSAFCTKDNGCAADTDCPSGFWCGAITNVKDAKGNVDFANPIKACLMRKFCDPCETDLDCSFTQGSICVPDVDGEKFCSLPCDPKKNSCIVGAGCVDVGEGVFACRPDTGACHSKGAPAGCGSCRIDSDCGPNSLCRDGSYGYKPSMKWCSVPCGEPDASGKRSCPVAPNGAEMVCLDENEVSYGGPFSSADPNYIYGMCFRPLTVDNTAESKVDPPNDTCGNAKREGDEECDDGNTNSTDGCDKCKITANCRFTAEEPSGDGTPGLKQNGADVASVPASCRSFLVEGAIDSAGDIDTFTFPLPGDQYVWFEAFTDSIGSCNADLVAEVRSGEIDLNKKCKDLSSVIKNLDAGTLCSDNKLGCGSCTVSGICGTCDDDAGQGFCPRMLLSNTLSVQGYEVKFASLEQTARIYAHDPAATVSKYIVVVDRLTAGIQGPKNPPAPLCH